MAGPFLSLDRLQTITKRQPVGPYSSDYRPAIRATRDEAPRISRPTILRPRKLGREMHLLSDPETAYALIALYHPGVFDIHEQHVVSCLPALHPLSGHPEVAGQNLSDLAGSIASAETLGALARHPKIFVESLEGGGGWVPFPYIGDLLLFLRDGVGLHCVNWTIKNKHEEFREKRLLPGMKRRKVRVDIDDFRHRVEAHVFAAARIPTRQLALGSLSVNLVRNLRILHGWDARDYAIDESLRTAVTAGMRDVVGTTSIGFQRMRELSQQHGCPIELIKAVAYSAVWRRDIRVDLFRPLLIDRPWAAEASDPLEVHADWFRREEWDLARN